MITKFPKFVRNKVIGQKFGQRIITRKNKIIVSAASLFPSGLTHSWSFDETSGTRVDSVAGINLTDESYPTPTTAGINGNCAILQTDFTLGANVLSSSSQMALTPPFSMVVWFYILSLTGDAKMELLTNWTLTNGMRFIIDASLFNFFPTGDTDSITHVYTNNAWHMVVGTYDGTNGKLSYDNGVYASVSSAGGQSTDRVAFDTEIGVNVTQTWGYFDAWMTFNHVLSATEVSNLWNGGIGRFS